MRTVHYYKIKKLKRKSATEVTFSVICHRYCKTNRNDPAQYLGRI
jgi:hypothetical protein